MIIARPQGWFSQNYDLTPDDGPVVALAFKWIGEQVAFAIEGIRFTVRREGVFSGHFTLRALGAVQADARKRSVFTRTFEVDLDDGKYELVAASTFGRGFELHRHGRRVGWIEPVSMWSRQVECELPEHFPLPVQIFILSVVLLQWRRQRQR